VEVKCFAIESKPDEWICGTYSEKHVLDVGKSLDFFTRNKAGTATLKRHENPVLGADKSNTHEPAGRSLGVRLLW